MYVVVKMKHFYSFFEPLNAARLVGQHGGAHSRQMWLLLGEKEAFL